jgi:hypothetical protein
MLVQIGRQDKNTPRLLSDCSRNNAVNGDVFAAFFLLRGTTLMTAVEIESTLHADAWVVGVQQRLCYRALRSQAHGEAPGVVHTFP